MTAEIISIGDELLIGQVVNTNQTFIAEQLHSIGISVERMTSVGDHEAEIVKSFREAAEKYDVIIVTGGLGPTHDDVTRTAVCDFFETTLVENKEALANIERIFASRNIELLEINRQQALVPQSCIPIPNRFGTAPGYFFSKGKKFFFVLPGVPYEMEAMMRNFVIPRLSSEGVNQVILHKTLRTTGIAESFLAKRIGTVEVLFKDLKGISLAYLPNPSGVRLRLTVKSSSKDEAQNVLMSAEKLLRDIVGIYVYGADDEELEEVVGRLLIEKDLTIAIAESCTGGLVADRITNVSGSSQYFERGIITYSNESKIYELGVPHKLLHEFGAVSREIAEAMAIGVRKKSNTDIGLSTTGIAGPTGGSEEKPVGLIWIAYSDMSETIALRFYLGDDRRRFKERASQTALELLRRKLLKIKKS